MRTTSSSGRFITPKKKFSPNILYRVINERAINDHRRTLTLKTSKDLVITLAASQGNVAVLIYFRITDNGDALSKGLKKDTIARLVNR